MIRLEAFKSRISLLLVIGILMIIAGFIIVGCGTDPQFKVQDPDAGPFAIDFTDCPDQGCILAMESNSFTLDKNKIGNKQITIEAWIQPKSTSTSTIISRNDGARGAKITVDGISGDTSQVIPKFTINRLVTDPITSATSTVSYSVSGSNVLLNAWKHIAGIVANTAHTHAVTADCTVAAMAETPHLDIFVDGAFSDCATSRGGDPDDTAIPLGFAHEPTNKELSSSFNGIIDEVRIWTTDRTDLIATCKDKELVVNSGDCGRKKESLIGYFRFNEGEGVNRNNSSTSDTQGLGIAGLEYPDPDPEKAGEFLGWKTGWTSDTPF